MTDSYAVTAEYYDLMAAPYWARVGPLVPGLLGGVDTVAGPVVDAGAGTGLSTFAIAEALPDAEVVAVEPAPAMRAVLMSRLAARKDLRERVTVLAGDLFDVALPRPCAGLVALGVLGHFDAAARARLWELAADLLAPGAPAIVEVQQPGRVEARPAHRYTRARLGRIGYEGWSEAVPVDDESLIWRMSYLSYDGDDPVDARVTEHRVWPVGPDEVAREAASAGLTRASGAPDAGLLVLTTSHAPTGGRA